MKKIFSQITIVSFQFFMLVVLSLNLLACSSEEDTADEQASLTEAENMLTLVNKARADAGLNTLVLNDALNKAAYKHSLDMNTNDYFAHTGLNGSNFSKRATDAGYTGFPAGENIAKGQSNTTATHASWMNSDGHKANILKTGITEMGLGLSGVYWTQIFGTEN